MRNLWRLFAIALSLVLMAGCGTATTAPTSEPRPTATNAPAEEPPEAPTATLEPMDEEEAPTPTAEAPTPTAEMAEPAGQIDGIVDSAEYPDTATFGDVQLWWRHDGEYLTFAMEGPTEGWISIGIEPSRGMEDADFLFGFVDDGEAQFWDAYGTAPAGASHPPDEDLGGTNDVVDFAGVEENGVTRFEVQIPLASGDTYDKELVPGETYAIIIAMGASDEYNSRHFFVTSGELVLSE